MGEKISAGIDRIKETLRMIKAEGGEDYAGDPLCRVYFDFTNNSQETTTFLMALDLNVMQDQVQKTMMPIRRLMILEIVCEVDFLSVIGIPS